MIDSKKQNIATDRHRYKIDTGETGDEEEEDGEHKKQEKKMREHGRGGGGGRGERPDTPPRTSTIATTNNHPVARWDVGAVAYCLNKLAKNGLSG